MDQLSINAHRVAAQIVVGQGYRQSIVEPIHRDGDWYPLTMRALIVPLQVHTAATFARPDHLLATISNVNAQAEICLADAAASHLYGGLPAFSADDALVAQARLARDGLDGEDLETALEAWRGTGLTADGAVHLLRYAALAIGDLDPDDPDVAPAVATQAERVSAAVTRYLASAPVQATVDRVARRLLKHGRLQPERVQGLMGEVPVPGRLFGFPADYGWGWLQQHAGLPMEHEAFHGREAEHDPKPADLPA